MTTFIAIIFYRKILIKSPWVVEILLETNGKLFRKFFVNGIGALGKSSGNLRGRYHAVENYSGESSWVVFDEDGSHNNTVASAGV